MFKFILPSDEKKKATLRSVFANHPVQITERNSSKNTYVSISIEGVFRSPDQIISKYKAVAQIERQEGRRDTLTPDDFLHEAGSNLGWREYRVFRNSLTNELNKRMQAGGSGSLNAQSNFDLWNQRRNFVTELSRKNPMWASEFNKIGDPVTQKKILEGFRLIVEDEAFAYRPEIPLIQRYLQLHDGIAQSLLARAEATGNRSYLRLSYTRNQDLSRQWEIGVLQLLTFPDFGNIYDRYFSNIESVNTSNLSQFAPATLRTGD